MSNPLAPYLSRLADLQNALRSKSGRRTRPARPATIVNAAKIPPEILCLPENTMTGQPELRVTLIRDRHRTIRISVHQDQTVTVKAPERVKRAEIMRTLALRREWIENKQAMFATLPARAEHSYKDGDTFLFLGRSFPLRLLPAGELPGELPDELAGEFPDKLSGKPSGKSLGKSSEKASGKRLLLPKARLRGKVMEITGHNLSPERVAKAIAKWRRCIGQQILGKRLAMLHQYACASLNDSCQEPYLALRAFTRRWGSCSSKGEITLAVSLTALPLPLLDYVILHELCHLRHFNHSKAFHATLECLVPDFREREREIRRIRLDMVRD